MYRQLSLLRIASVLVFLTIAIIVLSGRLESKAQADSGNDIPYYPGADTPNTTIYLANLVAGENNGQLAYIRTDGSQAASPVTFKLSPDEMVKRIPSPQSELGNDPFYSSVIY